MGIHSRSAFFTGLIVKCLAVFTVIIVIIIGVGLGLSLAYTANIKNQENFIEFAPALPTKILDINGILITEFSADEKRELVSLSELPRHLILAVLSREDPDFYNHKGFSIRGITRAFVGQMLGKDWGGGSTITQQVAGTLYTDRRERSMKRKIKELWWSFQMERRYTKNEILEIYLNYMNMGPGTYGVETASKYFFDHSAREVTVAEAAVLAVLLSNPTRFNPIANPEQARNRQHYVLERMIQFGHITEEEAEASFDEYWQNYDWTRPAISAYYRREDKAPWFSEYVRRELDGMLYGAMDYYRDGYVVYTTMDLHHQETAEKLMAEGLERANREYLRYSGRSYTQAERTYIPIVDLLSIFFDLPDIHAAVTGQSENKAISRYTKTINPIVDMAALAFGIPELKEMTNKSFSQLKLNSEYNVVEGALICIENETGYITAIVGGSRYDESNQLIRASQANVQYGSAFKPLFYSAAIDTRKFTAATMIYDSPIVFHNDDGTPYIPLNFGGVWRGSVLFYEALVHSLNVASVKIMDGIGFDAAIDRASALLDITDPSTVRRSFPRVYPLALGVTSSAPINLARAFAVFGNQGRVVTPISIKTIEDRNGRVVKDVERDIRQIQRRMGNDQVVSPQNAYIMSRIMEKTVDYGTLAHGAGWGSKFSYKDENGRTFKMPVAGKTGTPQNWSDAWAVGFSPYYTTAVWFGFDKPGNSLGVDLSGSTLSGPVWGDYMREIHRGLPRRDFARPASGIIDVTVCAKSGLLKTASCTDGEVTLPFLEGTQPGQYCEYHGNSAPIIVSIPIGGYMGKEEDEFINSLRMPTLDFDLLPELRDTPQTNRNQNNRQNNNNRNNRTPSVINNPIPNNDPNQFPDTAVQFTPDQSGGDFQSEEYGDEYEDDLPRWNHLD